MRSPSWLTVLMCLLIAMLTGCTSVTSTAVLGQPSPETAKALQGVWKIGDGVMFIMAGENGQLDAALVMRKESQWEMKTYEFIATKIGEASYINVRQQEDQNPQDQHARYHFARLLMEDKKSPSAILVLSANPETFQQAVDNGELAGTVILHQESRRLSQVNLRAEAQALMDFVKPELMGSQFTQQPLTLTRLSHVEDDKPSKIDPMP